MLVTFNIEKKLTSIATYDVRERFNPPFYLGIADEVRL
jgi:hypothetical protein